MAAHMSLFMLSLISLVDGVTPTDKGNNSGPVADTMELEASNATKVILSVKGTSPLFVRTVGVFVNKV